MLVAILNETIVAGMVVLLHRRPSMWLSASPIALQKVRIFVSGITA
jgi:hypothetical protein